MGSCTPEAHRNGSQKKTRWRPKDTARDDMDDITAAGTNTRIGRSQNLKLSPTSRQPHLRSRRREGDGPSNVHLEYGLSDTTIAEYTGIRPEDDEESVQALSRDW